MSSATDRFHSNAAMVPGDPKVLNAVEIASCGPVKVNGVTFEAYPTMESLRPKENPDENAIYKIRREVERLMLAFPLLPLTGPVVLEALRGVGEHMLSYYDAQIWAVARLGQVAVVLSEDFNPGAVLDGVSFTNPLDPEFDLA